MADAPSRAQRASALEEKRRRLEDLKKRRTQRADDPKPAANLDEYIDGLLSAAPPVVVGVDSSEEVATQEAQTAAPATGSQATTTTPTSETPSEGAPAVVAPESPRRPAVETFTIATQTEPEDVIVYDNEDDEEGDDANHINNTNNHNKTAAPDADETTTTTPTTEEQDKHTPKILDIDQVKRNIASPEFTSFINTASKKVERLLGALQVDDLLVDYVGASADAANQTANKEASNDSRFLSSKQVYECGKWTSTREVTDLDWSPLHREVLLSTYHMPNSSTTSSTRGSTAVSAVSASKETLSSSMTPRSGELQSDGLVLLWNLTMLQRPEHIFTCGSPVMTGRFHVEPTLVLGGCESGQLVIWDTRAGRLPVQKSALSSVVGASSKGHVHPISNMEIIEGGLGLVTSSSDGRVNYWSLANLREPADSIQVSDSVSCFAVAPESETVLVGDEMGSLFTIQSAASSSSTSASSGSSSQNTGSRTSSRKYVRKLETVDADGNILGHYGMVTSLSTKLLKKGAATRTAALSKGFLRGSGGLVLSCGVDWTVKLWAPAYSESPLLSMVSHSYDYMSDVQWSPTHPSLFATASSNGTLALWNLATSLEDPLTGNEGLVIDPDAMSGRGLNKLKWAADGRRIAVGSGDQVHVVSLNEEVSRPKGDEDAKIMNQLMARGLIGRQ